MKEQKYFIYCFGAIAVISVISGVFLEFEWDRYFILRWENCFTGHRPFIVNLSVGIGTGAFLAFVTAWINYLSEKRKFITYFFEMCEDFCNALHKLQYLYFETDAHLWAAYYNEFLRNEKFLCAKKDNGNHRTANDDLIDWYKSKYPESNSEALLQYRKNAIEENLSSVAKSYYEFSGYNFLTFDRIMKKSSFIRQRSKQQMKIKEIYSYISENYKNITSIVGYMQDFNASNNMIIQIDRLQSMIFGDIQPLESDVSLPPANKIEKHIKALLNDLNDTRRKSNAQPTT